MKLETFISKFSDLTLTSEVLKDLKSIHYMSYRNIPVQKSTVKIIRFQIVNNIFNLLDRHVKLKTTISNKDSSSLAANILRYGDEFGAKFHAEKTNKCKHTLEGYIEKYGDAGIEKFEKVSTTKSMSLVQCIRRYGDIEGPIKFRNFWGNTGFGTSLAHCKRRTDNDESAIIEYNRLKQSISFGGTRPYYIEKYGEIYGNLKFDSFVNSKKITKKRLFYKMVERGMTIKEIQQDFRHRWDNTSLKSFQHRHGDTVGYTLFNEMVAKNKKSNKMCVEYYIERGIDIDTANNLITERVSNMNNTSYGVSAISLKVLLPIQKLLVDEFNSIKTRINDDEFFIKLTNKEYEISGNRVYFYDFADETNKLIIEYHGTRYHEDVDYNTTILSSMEDFHSNFCKDLFKKWIGESRGFKVVVLREWNLKADLMDLYEYLNNIKDISKHSYIFM